MRYGTAARRKGGPGSWPWVTVRGLMELKQPVRVLWKANSKNRYAPKEGLCQDGMYLITEKELVDEKRGMMRFKLVRCPVSQL
jgi:hypothetical protein